jgi:hypothetical protein
MVDPVWQAEVEAIPDPQPSDLFYNFKKGCCQCERHFLPYFYLYEKADLGYPDNKHGYQQISIMSLEHAAPAAAAVAAAGRIDARVSVATIASGANASPAVNDTPSHEPRTLAGRKVAINSSSHR